MALRLILLDRNAVACVKASVAGKIQPEDRLAELRRLDKRRNTISPILSIIEGQSGRRESNLELQKTIQKESKAVSDFFKRARTDSGYLESNIDLFAEVFSAHIEHSWDGYVSFVTEAQKHIFQPVAQIQRLSVEGRLITLAEKHRVSLKHPVFLVTLAVLYGSDAARRVLKPKPEYKTEEKRSRAAHNVVSDLIVISRIGLIRSTMPDADKRFGYVRYFTFDKGLSVIANAIRIISENTHHDGEDNVTTAITVTCERNLFPELDDDNWERFCSVIGVDAGASGINRSTEPNTVFEAARPLNFTLCMNNE